MTAAFRRKYKCILIQRGYDVNWIRYIRYIPCVWEIFGFDFTMADFRRNI